MKKLLYVLLGFVGLLVVAVVAISLLFDPNDYRDRIAEAVKRDTGRDLVIEGDLDLSFFPWLAIKVGRTTLGNAPGFGDEPFLRFEEARASVRMMPLISGQGLELGSIVLDAFELNLEVAANGRNNWQDLAESRDDEEPETSPEGRPEGQEVSFGIASVAISDAAVRYNNAQDGESYSLTDFNLATGRVGGGDPVDIQSSFNFELQPADVQGDFAIETTITPDSEGGMSIGDAEISALGVDATLAVADDGSGARLQVDAFSLKSLLQRLNIDPPVTADPDALGKIILDATINMDGAGVAGTDVELVVDDTTFRGDLSRANGRVNVNLVADSINLDRYMEPAADASAGGGDAVPVEIPVGLIRALNVRGKLAMESARLGGMDFENVRIGVNASDGNLRLQPIAADLYGGKYEGDVRIIASGNVPSLSVNENVSDVDLGALATAMFDRQNITGAINGSFKLAGRGENLAAIQRSLDGNITMELTDGTWEGVDVWYELRRARALYKKETPPEPTTPARTEFSNVRVSGPVTDGVFKNDDIFAELPFMRLTGKGTVDFPSAKIDYRLNARILERPEFAAGATKEELEEFTEAKIPLRVTGSLLDPSIKPDIEEMLKDEVRKKVEDEVKDRLKKLLGD